MRPIRLETAQLAELAAQVAALVPRAEPEQYLTKQGLADALGCSVRSVEGAMKAGLPHWIIFGKAKFLRSETDPWLELHGYIERRLDVAWDNGRDKAARATLETPPGPTPGGQS